MASYKDIIKRGQKHGKTIKEIEKDLRLERKEYTKYAKEQYKTSEIGKRVFSKENQKNNLLEYRKELRTINPTRISLTTKKRNIIPKSYIQSTYKSKVDKINDPTGMRGIMLDYVENTKIPLTKNQTKKLKEFSKDFKKQSRQINNKFLRQNKSLDISHTKVNFKGSEYSLTELHDLYIKTQNSQQKSQIRKELNKTFKDIKSIKTSEIRKVRRQNIRFNVSNYKKTGKFLENVNNAYNTVTVDSNGNKFGWEIIGSETREVISVAKLSEGNDVVLHREHISELELQGIDFTNPASKATLERFYLIP